MSTSLVSTLARILGRQTVMLLNNQAIIAEQFLVLKMPAKMPLCLGTRVLVPEPVY